MKAASWTQLLHVGKVQGKKDSDGRQDTKMVAVLYSQSASADPGASHTSPLRVLQGLGSSFVDARCKFKTQPDFCRCISHWCCADKRAALDDYAREPRGSHGRLRRTVQLVMLGRRPTPSESLHSGPSRYHSRGTFLGSSCVFYPYTPYISVQLRVTGA